MKSILKASAAVAALLVLSAGAASASPCVITGTSGDDTLTATPQIPPCSYYVLQGLAGDDTLTGASTDDRLWPGTQSLFHSGHDTMTGNGGADIFFLEDTAGSLGSNAQEITDFTHGTDKIGVFPVCHAHSVTCTFIGNSAFSGTAGEIRYGIPSGSAFGTMQLDLDGDGTSDFDVKLDGAPTVTSSDILFVLPPLAVAFHTAAIAGGKSCAAREAAVRRNACRRSCSSMKEYGCPKQASAPARSTRLRSWAFEWPSTAMIAAPAPAVTNCGSVSSRPA